MLPKKVPDVQLDHQRLAHMGTGIVEQAFPTPVCSGVGRDFATFQ